MRERGHEPQAVAHFVNRLVFCMFPDDVGLLPDHMFTRMLRHARPAPERFTELAGDLFEVMATGGRVGFETLTWFNGGLFDDSTALPMEKSDIETVLAAADLDWSEVDPSILGTLFERSLDPGKRAQLGAHYTDRDKIMLLVEPVVIRPLLVECEAEKAAITADLERAEVAKSSAARTKRRNEAERRQRAFLEWLRRFTVLDPACGSGNFLYLALQALKDPRPRLQSRSVHHGEGRPRHRLQEAEVRQRLAPRRGEPARRTRRHRPWHLPPRRRRPLGRRHDVGQRRAALRHAAQGPLDGRLRQSSRLHRMLQKHRRYASPIRSIHSGAPVSRSW